MLKYLIVCAGIALGVSVRASAQLGQWKEVNTAIQSDPMVFATNDSGYSFEGTDLLRSTDGGKNFSSSGIPGGSTIGVLSDMSWPTSRCGYMAFGSPRVLARTNDGGQSITIWNFPSNYTVYHIAFPTPAIGYATGDFNPSTEGYFVAKSTDSGESWRVVYQNDLSIGSIRFKDADHGIFVIYDKGGVPQVAYTLDGFATESMSADTIPFLGSGQQTGFLDWNDDGSWIVYNQGIERSSDSGKHWYLVLQDESPDLSYGAIESVCFSGPRGFAFADNSNVFETTDDGATWKASSSTSPDVTGSGSVSSMPSPTVAYVTGTSADGSTNVLLKIQLPPVVGGGVSTPQLLDDFHVASNGAGLIFIATPVSEARNIEILDLLGRDCASLMLAAMSARAELRPGQLRPGSYFARLGNEIAKFSVWQ